jgi:hypothetical protein
LENTTTTVGGLTIAGIGDPEFTPDKTETPADGADDDPLLSPLARAGEELATTVRGSTKPVDVAMVHDPEMAGPLSGTCPLVLAGHRHQREVSVLPAVPGGGPTRLMIEGSTGGAGLRGLEGEEPTPLTLSVLYFDENRTLKAYDDIRLGGTGQSQVTLERKVIGAEPEPVVDPSVVPSR